MAAAVKKKKGLFGIQVNTNPFVGETPQELPQSRANVPPPTVTPKATLKQPEIFRDEKTGNLSGIEINGKTYLGLSPEEIRAMVEADKKNKELPQGTQEVGTQRAAEEQAQQQQQAAEQVGANPLLSSIEATQQPSQVDTGQVVRAGLGAAIPKILGATGAGAVGGAVIGGSAGLGVGAVPGAIVGGIAGLIGGIYSAVIGNIKKQKTDNFNAQKKVLTDGRNNLNKLATLAKADPANSMKYAEAFNQQAAKIAEAHSQLQLDVRSSYTGLTSDDATQQLQAFENFYTAGGQYEILKTKMQLAIMGGQLDPMLELQLLQNEGETEVE